MFKNMYRFSRMLFCLFIAGLICISCSKKETVNTIKIGMEANLQSDLGIDWSRAVQLMAEQDNKKGGLDIGGTKYKVELIIYDSKFAQNSEVAAINRLVYEDKVKFIISEGKFAFGWLATTEKEKVIAFNAPIPSPASLGPQLHYSFNATFGNPMVTVFAAWYFNKYPEECNSFVMASPDNQIGHMLSQITTSIFKVFNIKPMNIFFPPNSTDLSALATKVKQLDPKLFSCIAPSSAQTGVIFNSVRKAGYTGKFMIPNLTSTEVLTKVMSSESLKEFICITAPYEFDPPLTEAAKEFKKLWIEKYGKWQSPNINLSQAYSALKEALIKTGTLDTEKVAATLSSGLEYESPMGTGKMISRPDFGNNRTVDSIGVYYVKQMKNGKPVLLDTISMDEGIKIFRKAYPPAAPGAVGPPPDKKL